MPFIEVDIKDAREGEVVPEGNYALRIIKYTDKDSKKGNPMTEVLVKIESDEHPNAMPIRHFILYPTADLEPDMKAMRLRDIARFLQAFSIPHEGNGFDTDDLPGATCDECMVVQEPGDDNQIYNRIILPRMKEEEEEVEDKRPSQRNRRGRGR